MTLTVYENLRTDSLNHKFTVFKVYCIRAEIDEKVTSAVLLLQQLQLHFYEKLFFYKFS